MTYSLACGDVIAGCSAVLEGSTEDELMVNITKHAEEGHQITEFGDDVIAMVKAAIRTS